MQRIFDDASFPRPFAVTRAYAGVTSIVQSFLTYFHVIRAHFTVILLGFLRKVDPSYLPLLFVTGADMLVARKPTNRDSDTSDKLSQFRIKRIYERWIRSRGG